MKTYKSNINISGHALPITIEYAETLADAIKHLGGEKKVLDLFNDAYALKQRAKERVEVVKRALNRVQFETEKVLVETVVETDKNLVPTQAE